ncbi:hypothetical protein D1835_03860 [Enterococcus asini]|nr:hypothetical protein [Enterococcus asini]
MYLTIFFSLKQQNSAGVIITAFLTDSNAPKLSIHFFHIDQSLLLEKNAGNFKQKKLGSLQA